MLEEIIVKPLRNDVNPYKTLLKECEYQRYMVHNFSEYRIFACMLEMIGEATINDMIHNQINCNQGEHYDIFFTSFYKSVRQVGFIGNKSDIELLQVNNRFNRKKETQMESVMGQFESIFWNFHHISQVPYELMQRIFDDWCQIKDEKKT